MTILALALTLLLQEPQDGQEKPPRLPPDPPDVGKLPVPLARSPSSVTVITGDELRQSGVRFLVDALRLVPGMEISRESATESNVSTRGYNDEAAAAQGMLALIDGRPVYNEFFGNVLWEALPVALEAVDRIEVVRGPGSFVYGPNAMHGVVSIITKSPLQYDEDKLLVSGSYGTYGSATGTIIYVRRDKDNDSGFKATLAWDDIDSFAPGDDNTKDKVFFETRYERLLGAHRVEITAGVDRQKIHTLIPTFLGVPTAGFESEIFDEFVKVDYQFGQLKATATWNGFNSESTPDRIYHPFKLDLDTFDVEAHYTTDLLGKLGRLTAGAAYRYATFNTEDEDVSLGRHHTSLVSVYAQDEIELGDTVFITGGLRLDDHSVSGTRTSPRLAVVWKFLEEQYLRASAGYGFRNPDLRELWFAMPVDIAGLPLPVTVNGNTDLEAEKIRSFELAYFGRPVKDRLRLEVVAYYNLIDRLVLFETTAFFPSPPFPPGTPSDVGPDNSGKEEAYGAEAEVQYQLSTPVSAFANYSYGIRRDRDTRDRITFAPRQKANAGVRVHLAEEGLDAMLWATFFDEVEFEAGKEDPYVLVNARVSYAFPVEKMNLKAFVQAFNLLDSDHRENPAGDSYGLLLSGGLEIKW